MGKNSLPIWLIIMVIILGIVLGTQYDKDRTKDLGQTAVTSSQKGEQVKYLDGITMGYLASLFQKMNGFKSFNTSFGTTKWVTIAKFGEPNSKVEIIIEIHHNTRDSEIDLIDMTIDSSQHEPNKNNVEVLTKFASTFFGMMAQLPYKSSKPDEAKAWVEENAKNAIKEGTVFTEHFGVATYNLYGSPTMRFFEIDAINSNN
jgi:hypothetical protein